MRQESTKPYSTVVELVAILAIFVLAQTVGGYFKVVAERTWAVGNELGTFIAYTSGMVLAVLGAIFVRSLGGGAKLPRRSYRIYLPHSTIMLWGILLAVAMSVVVEPLTEAMPSRYYEMVLKTVGTGTWAILTTVVAAPILEEILFRGIVQDVITRRWGGLTGIFFGALIFGLIHIIPQQMVAAFAVGLVLGYVYMRTRSLLAVVIIHAINNILSYLMMAISNGAATTVRDMVGNAGWYYTLYGVCAALVLVSALSITGNYLRLKYKRKSANG